MSLPGVSTTLDIAYGLEGPEEVVSELARERMMIWYAVKAFVKTSSGLQAVHGCSFRSCKF